jgi:3-methyladenine DNA glycosylase AlkD
MSEMDWFLKELPGTPNASEVIRALEKAFLRLGGEPAYLTGMKMVVPGAGVLYGVKVPVLRNLSKEIRRRYKDETEVIREIAEACWYGGSREHQLVALFMLGGIVLDPSARWTLGVRFLPEVSNWESCDQLCLSLLGQALAEDPGYMEILETWLDDENLWVRRAALVAPVFLRRAKFPTDLAEELDRRTLAMASVLIDDEEHYIRKAVDWTVREVIKRHYRIGLEWLRAEARSMPSKIAKSTLRLASKKLMEGDQEAFLTLLEG